MTKLQRTRDAFNSYMKGFDTQKSRVDTHELDALGFELFAAKIQDEKLKQEFCHLAFDMIEANLLEHLKEIPELSDIRSAESVRALREWREVLVTWEKVLQALRRAGDA